MTNEQPSWWLASYWPPQEGREPLLFQEIDQSRFDEAVKDALLVTLFVERHHYDLVRAIYRRFLEAMSRLGRWASRMIQRSRNLEIANFESPW
jgi:hypothetical protein